MRAWLCVIALCVALGPGAAAQAPHAITLRVDNDAFDFWHAPGHRPDEEYTSGVRLMYDAPSSPWWASHFTKGLADCRRAADVCRARRLEFGQDLFTPRRTADSPNAAPGSRANAGWLFIQDAARLLRQRRLDEYSVTLGVTGEPALGQITQRIAHGFAPGFSRPIDWSQQLHFEPGVIMGYEQQRRVALGALDFIPRVHVDLGNVKTDAEAGVHFRTGVHRRHPWLPAAANAPVEVAVSGGATARAVLRDLFVDGVRSQPDTRVGHEPFVYAADWTVSLRWRAVEISYGAVSETREYERGPRVHTWSSLQAGVYFAR